MYKESALVKVAQRANNPKRGYLLVNPLQGKHVPVSPKLAMLLFTQLAQCLEGYYEGETILYIGFAETATALGAKVAVERGGYYLQTTREPMEGVEFFYFSESHSHATEQKLCKSDLEEILPKVQRLVFVEDEVTTGNTILQIVEQLRHAYGAELPISVLSVLNGMEPEALERYAQRNIPLHYLLKTDHSDYPQRAQAFSLNGVYTIHQSLESIVPEPAFLDCSCDYVDTRRLCFGADYEAACESLWQWISSNVSVHEGGILVLGTEECMYPALYVAQQWEKEGHYVLCHSTTRSPIGVSLDSDYPLQEQYLLPSVYDGGRQTYLYQLAVAKGKEPLTKAVSEDSPPPFLHPVVSNNESLPYLSQVVIVTDCPNGQDCLPLCEVLASAGYRKITVVTWA